jgi:hypothetical protein
MGRQKSWCPFVAQALILASTPPSRTGLVTAGPSDLEFKLNHLPDFLPQIAALESGCYFIQTNGPNWQLNRTMDRLLSLHPFHAGPGPWSL